MIRFHRLAFGLLTPLALTGCFMGCGGQDEAVALARGLSKEQFERIYRDSREIYLKDTDGAFLKRKIDSAIPKQFEYLKPLSVTMRGNYLRIHMAGCYDDKTALLVEFIDDPSKARIRLFPREWERDEVLWEAEP